MWKYALEAFILLFIFGIVEFLNFLLDLDHALLVEYLPVPEEEEYL